MSAEVINGKDLAKKLRDEMKEDIAQLKQNDIYPHLTMILIGDDPASQSFVRGKKKASAETGIGSKIIELSDSTSEDELVGIIQDLNSNPSVHGILVQLPLPEHIKEERVIDTISPDKDVDGFHPMNIGRMMTGQKTLLPCTPYGIMVMLESRNIDITGKHAVIIGRSNIVGKPVGQLLLNKNATVTYCHSKTEDLRSHTKSADILVIAIGQPNTIGKNDVKDGVIVLDVGINRLEDGSLTGDVNFDEVKEKASYITPVPQGVGPMTVTMLLHNTIQVAKEI